MTNFLALFFRIRHAFQILKESVLGVYPHDLHTHIVRESPHDIVTFIKAQQAGIYEQAGQLISNSTVKQGCRDRGVHTARKPQEHVIRSHFLTDVLNGRIDNSIRCPFPPATADLMHKTLDNLPTLSGMRHLRVELQSIEAAILICHTCKWRVGCLGDNAKARRQGLDPVAMTHPDIQEPVPLGRPMILDIP